MAVSEDAVDVVSGAVVELVVVVDVASGVVLAGADVVAAATDAPGPPSMPPKSGGIARTVLSLAVMIDNTP